MIEFYYNETGLAVETANCNTYFVMADESVWGDNGNYYESQSSSVGFDDFIEKCEHIGWRVVK